MIEQFVPVPTPETQPFWEATSRGELITKRCDQCERPHFYPRMVCPFCGSTALSWIPLSGHGRLYSYIINYRPIPQREPAEIIAIVELSGGLRMMTNIIDATPEPGSLPLDAPVEVAFVERGGVSLPMFKIVEANQNSGPLASASVGA